MKRNLLALTILCISVAAFAFDFGGEIDNISKFADENTEDGLKLDQKNNASLWINIPFGQTSNYLLLKGRYQFEKDFGEETTTNALDIELAQAVFNENGFNLSVGRFYNTDLSGYVFSQQGDGASLSYSTPGFSAAAYGFYTGLLNSQFVTILDPEYEADDDAVYDLNPKYLVSGVRASLLSFLGGEHSVSAEVSLAARLEGDSYNRLYAEGKLEGPLFMAGLFYDVTGVVEFSKYSVDDTDDNDGSETDFLAGANLYFYPGFKDSVIKAGTVFASGADTDKNSSKNGFIGFTSMTAVNSLSEPEYNGIFKTGLSASLKPAPSFRLGAGADLIFDTADSSFDYTGFQYNADLDWQIASDVYAGAGLTQYFGKDNSDDDKTAITLRAAITF